MKSVTFPNFSSVQPEKLLHKKEQTLAFLGAKYSKLLSHFNVVYGAFATDKNPQLMSKDCKTR